MKWRLSIPCSLLVALICFFPCGIAPVAASMARPVQQLVGEDRLYAIDFLFFSNLAEGRLRLSATTDAGIYKAELIGRTLGVASWLSGERTQSYTSLLSLAEDGSFRSVEHVSKIMKRKRGKWHEYGHYYYYDYQSQKVVERKEKAGVFTSQKEKDMPEGHSPVDMLAAFYNLRAGVYGQLEHGARFHIPTYAKGKFTEIEIRVLTVEEQAKYGYFRPGGLLVAANIDPEVFETHSGDLYVWFNDDGIPERGIVEDLIGLGDVKGYLAVEGL